MGSAQAAFAHFVLEHEFSTVGIMVSMGGEQRDLGRSLQKVSLVLP